MIKINPSTVSVSEDRGSDTSTAWQRLGSGVWLHVAVIRSVVVVRECMGMDSVKMLKRIRRHSKG